MFFIVDGIGNVIGYPQIMVSLWLGAMYLVAVNVVIQFFYRYSVLCKGTSCSKRTFLAFYFIAVLYCFIHGFMIIPCLNEDSNNNLKMLMEHPLFQLETPSFTVMDTVGKNYLILKKNVT